MAKHPLEGRWVTWRPATPEETHALRLLYDGWRWWCERLMTVRYGTRAGTTDALLIPHDPRGLPQRSLYRWVPADRVQPEP